MWFQDARLFQIIFLALFLTIGIGTRDWSLHPSMIATAIAICAATQIITVWCLKRHTSDGLLAQTLTYDLRSPLITALGISLLLRVDHYGPLAIACCAAILSKFLIRSQGKQVFNPANFGIITALCLSYGMHQEAWVSPGQWGEEGWYAAMFLATGGVVLGKVGRWDTTIAFLGTYSALEVARNVYLGWTWDVVVHRLMSGSLIMFALFMITDPRSIPNAQVARWVWAIAIAVLTFLLRNYLFLSTAVFWALFVLSPFTMLLDRLFQGDRFVWLKPTAQEGTL